MPWPSNADLPESVKGLPGHAQSIFREAANAAIKDGKSDASAMKIGWAAVKNAGYHKDGDKWVAKATDRKLTKFDETRSNLPFPYEDSALAKLRNDQVPRMLGAITHPELNDVVRFKWEDLVGVQNRVETKRVEDIAKSDQTGPAGIVAKFAGKNHILDGHHRTAGYWLRGDEDCPMHYINLQPMSNAMKADAKVCKVDETLGLVFGWAIICKIDGEDYFDTQESHIPESVMLKSATDAAPTLVGADMHQWEGEVLEDGVPIQKGDITFMFPLTTEIAKAMGLETATTGLMIAYKPHSAEILKKFKDGTYTGFSVGGSATTKDVEA